jgi:hypothetical protein
MCSAKCRKRHGRCWSSHFSMKEKTGEKQKSKSAGSARIFLILPALLCLAPVCAITAVLVSPLIQEAYLRLSFKMLDNAVLIYEDSAGKQANIAQKSLYYWTETDVLSVKANYEAIYPAFRKSGDEDGEWYISASGADIFQDTAPFLYHGAFCSRATAYRCVSITLVDAAQPDYYRMAVSSPSDFRRLVEPEPLKSVPRTGTFIILSYYIDDW